MNLKNILNQFNLASQCKKNGLSLWQCPQFLFVIMGIVIIASSLTTFAVANRYIEEPETVALIVLILSAMLFIISFMIIQGFERLAEAYRMKSEFVSIVSHQLRSPLSNLQLTIELLVSGRAGKIEKEQVEYLKTLKENSARMQELVSDLLMVSRIESEKLFFKNQKFSLLELINDVVSGFDIFAKSSNIEVNIDYEKDLPNIFADPTKIRLVIENFLDNAIRYTKSSGEVKIIVRKEGNKIYVGVRDTGVGVPKEDQKNIFQKFFRAENAMKYQTKGSGLGLYIAKAIVEKSKGKIGFKSQENKGSIFWFTLPIK